MTSCKVAFCYALGLGEGHAPSYLPQPRSHNATHSVYTTPTWLITLAKLSIERFTNNSCTSMRALVLSLTLLSSHAHKKLYDLWCLTFALKLDLALDPALDLALTLDPKLAALSWALSWGGGARASYLKIEIHVMWSWSKNRNSRWPTGAELLFYPLLALDLALTLDPKLGRARHI